MTRPLKLTAIAVATIGFTVIIAVWTQPALLRVSTVLSLLTRETPSKLAVPVEDVASHDLADTWGAPRGVDRRHEGIDIFAPRGRPVISTTDGVVFKVGEDSLGGNVVRVLGPGWQWHYYAHLDRFGDVKPGSVVRAGTVLGYVGNTGNAARTPYHLHYGVYRFMGGAQNPYPLLATDRPEPKVAKSNRSDGKKLKPKRRPDSKQQATDRKLKSGKSTPTRPARASANKKGQKPNPLLQRQNLQALGGR
jgi:murein DD-endopeptidase MepM/ murein hydrolase activator NlpD